MEQIKKITAGLLLLAVLPLPYAYYTLLRIVVSIVAGISVWNSFEEGQTGWAFGLAIMVLMWNPIFPFYMDKTAWIICDLIGAGVLFFSSSNE